MSDFETLHFESSPDGTVDAIVEQDDRVAYFYLRSEVPGFGLKACWIRNLSPGPVTFIRNELEQGLPPQLPRPYCKHPEGAEPLDESSLRVVWLEEGNAAALLADEQTLALIPAWSGQDGFHGYASGCRTENQVCWPLPEDQRLHDRIGLADQYWQSWQHQPPWGSLQTELMDAYEANLGTHDRYFAIDGEKWPPKALVQFDGKEGLTLLTAGVSLRPQPNVELFTERPHAVRRIELGMRLPGSSSGNELGPLLQWLSSIANYPWHFHQWLGHGHTMPISRLESLLGSAFTAVLFCQPPSSPSDISMPRFRNDPINLLWLLPITAPEQAFAQEHGSQGLLERLPASSREGKHQDRSCLFSTGQA